MDQNIGKLLDNRYEILELIGVGGMAKVYKARCHRLNRLVAVKILRDDLSQGADFRRRFHDESQAVAMLSHPNIMAVYDVSRSSDLEYIVMELIDGITLKQYMQKKGNKLNWREALHFITQIVKALGHAHSRGIIHRDIKPHNVMVLRDGSVKVTDFGIARLASAGHSTLTQETLGSVHYISPEQARGSHIDARSDLYSAGVVLYEMITGRLPFEGDSPVSVAIQHINSIPLSPREINEDIPEALEAITMKAMAPNPDKRYVSADAMLADLEEFRKNPSINFEYTSDDLRCSLSEGNDTDEKTRPVPVAAFSSPEADSIQRRGRGVQPISDEPDSDFGYNDRRDGPAWPIFAAVAAILLFTGLVFWFLYSTFIQDMLTPSPTYTIPAIEGLIYESVVNDTERLGDFTLHISSTIASEEPEGTILKQIPDGNTTTKDPAAQISVTVSSGPEIIVMPDVTGKEYMKALVDLQNLGLSVPVPEYVTDEEVPSNHVVSFTPLEGTILRPGDKVQLVVSKGPAEKLETVPLFIGQTEEWARNKIKLQNLTEGTIYPVWSSEYEAGIVVDQSVAAYTEVPQGTVINLQVSKGVDPSTLPPAAVTRTFNISLPVQAAIIHVVVRDGSEVVLDRTVDSTLEAILPCTVTGTGVKNYEVYFDGTLQTTHTVDFNS
ncbi:MAG: Stk1 family PASTA domain-containing Ser/Thr kinase [Oscillospiraceae bacterium]|nr:Stk1 family PASTA domain-containing Ser/Thr kinase [Oscillospiraceae bacterium]